MVVTMVTTLHQHGMLLPACGILIQRPNGPHPSFDLDYPCLHLFGPGFVESLGRFTDIEIRWTCNCMAQMDPIYLHRLDGSFQHTARNTGLCPI